MMITKPYSDIRPRMANGDVVLFSGNSAISRVIKRITKSEWSHIGIVFRVETIDTVFLLESTTLSNLPDVEEQKPVKGVQLVDLGSRLATYDGHACVRHLNGPFTNEMYSTLTEFRKAVKGRPYEKDDIELIKSIYDGPGGDNSKDLSSLFCSELVAEAYQEIGVLSKGLPSDEFTPADFNEAGLADTLMVKPYTLSEKIYIAK